MFLCRVQMSQNLRNTFLCKVIKHVLNIWHSLGSTWAQAAATCNSSPCKGSGNAQLLICHVHLRTEKLSSTLPQPKARNENLGAAGRVEKSTAHMWSSDRLCRASQRSRGKHALRLPTENSAGECTRPIAGCMLNASTRASWLTGATRVQSKNRKKYSTSLVFIPL